MANVEQNITDEQMAGNPAVNAVHNDAGAKTPYPTYRMDQAPQQQAAAEKAVFAPAWLDRGMELAQKVLRDPFSPDHLPFACSGLGVLLILGIGITGAVRNVGSSAPKPAVQQTIATAPVVQAPVIINPTPTTPAITTPPADTALAETKEVVRLKDRIELMELQLADLLSQVGSVKSNAQTTARRLTDVEGAFTTITASIGRQVTNLPATPRNRRADRLPSITILPRDATTSVAPTSTDNDIPQFTQTHFALYLASNRIRETLVTYRNELRDTHVVLLKPLKFHIIPPAKGSRQFRLIAGPVRNIAKAAEICVKLKAFDRFCHQEVFPRSLLALAKP